MTATEKRRQAALAKQWANVPVGTKVIVRRDDGSDFQTRTRSEPWLLGHGAAVISVEGIVGGYLLVRVSRADPGAPPGGWLRVTCVDGEVCGGKRGQHRAPHTVLAKPGPYSDTGYKLAPDDWDNPYRGGP